MKHPAIFAIFISASLFISGCSSTPNKTDYHKPSVTKQDSSAQLSAIKEKLYAQYSTWKGTPYKMGGLSKGGIDCSGFVHMTYKQQLGLEIPRSTKLLADYGENIPRRALKAGDLVFFKTGWKQRHVGIYLEEGKFMHASTSKGVSIASLSDRYWKNTYWKAMRL